MHPDIRALLTKLVTKIQMLAIKSGNVKYNPVSMVFHDGSETESKTPTILPGTIGRQMAIENSVSYFFDLRLSIILTFSILSGVVTQVLT